MSPLLFLFPYDDVRPDVRLDEVVDAISQTEVSLIYQNPTPEPAITPYVDGFFAWVQPSTYDGWQPDGGDWGGVYLDWFYQTMANPTLPYSQMLTVGAVWPGFNDWLAPWRSWPPCSMRVALFSSGTSATASLTVSSRPTSTPTAPTTGTGRCSSSACWPACFCLRLPYSSAFCYSVSVRSLVSACHRRPALLNRPSVWFCC